MLAVEILRSFYAHTELATYYCECNFTPRGLAVQYCHAMRDALFISGLNPDDFRANLLNDCVLLSYQHCRKTFHVAFNSQLIQKGFQVSFSFIQ